MRLQRQRLGSVTLMAIVVMVVLAIVVITYNFVGVSTHRMLHHIYYNEKILAIFEGLDVIVRGMVQREFGSLLNTEPGEWFKFKKEDIDGELTRFGLLGDEDGELAKKFKEYLVVEARLKEKSLKPLPDFQSIKAKRAKDATLEPALQEVGSPEVSGRVEIHISITKDIPLQTRIRDGKEQAYFKIPARDVSMEYEFKRARVIPPFFRHFSLWLKEAASEKEVPESYFVEGNYNHATNPLTGRSKTGGILFVKSGEGTYFGTENSYSGEGLKGKFQSSLGYIYLGGENKIHLNLMAGDIDENAPFSETFHLYRGATTDFYKVWSTEFSNFVENSEVQTPGKDAPESGETQSWWQRGVQFFGRVVQNAVDWIKGAVQRALALDSLEQGSKNQKQSNALPLYYVVRKDYGYAEEWGQKQYQRFGFSSGEDGPAKIPSSSLHLYGANTDATNLDMGSYASGKLASPTIVLGNVYRRCLSLSGYKQRRQTDEKGELDGSTDRKFEVQAGPIEYFANYNDLMARSQDVTQEKERRPIWVWDARVRWNMDPNATAGDGNGTYLPISGAGLFGRIIPGLAKLWVKGRANLARELFDKSVGPPDDLDPFIKKDTNPTLSTDQDDNAPLFAAGMSPLFQMLAKGSFFDGSKHPSKDGYLYSGVSPYFEELLRCFSYTVAGLGSADEAIQKIRDEASRTGQQVPGGEGITQVKNALEGGKARWKALVESDDVKEAVMAKAIDASQIKDDKMRKFWEVQGSTGPRVFPFTLPDVWDNRLKGQKGGSTKENFRDTFESWVGKWPVDGANTPKDFFKLYFTPLMTNPARVLPYNYSLRFICTDLREIFTLEKTKRTELLVKKFPAEVTDGIGYMEEGVNKEYLDPEQYGEQNDVPLNDAVLKNIFKLRKGNERLEDAYFFMDEYGQGVDTPGGPNTRHVFVGRSFWQDGQGGPSTGGLMTWAEASRRFVSLRPADAAGAGGVDLWLNTVLGLADDKVTLGDAGPVTVHGKGVILVPGEVTISDDFKASAPVFIVADKITIDGNAKIVNAGLIAHDIISLSGSATDPLYIKGNVVAGGWDRASFTRSGVRLIDYNPAFKNLENYIANIEPRVRKFTSTDI